MFSVHMILVHVKWVIFSKYFLFLVGLSNFPVQQQQQQQRAGGMSGPQFRGTSHGHVTPTTMQLPINLQAPQQPSPNR